MADETKDLFAFSIDYAKARAAQLGGQFITGSAAFEKENTPVRRDLSETQFNIGDKINLPKDEKSSQWICAPLTRSTDPLRPQEPITRALCEVVSADGTTSVKELFLGTLMKSVQNRETKQTVSVTGSITGLTQGCITKKDVWSKLFGKTLEIVDIKMVPIIRRGFGGDADRLTETSVMTINVL